MMAVASASVAAILFYNKYMGNSHYLTRLILGGILALITSAC